MTVTFNGVVLADGESRTCKVASGLAPSGELGMEVLEFLRAEWAIPVARGNRVITLPMVIELPAVASFGLSLVSALMYFSNLPDEGTLVFAEGAQQVTFANAVCPKWKIVDEIVGVSYAVALQFVLGQPTNATLSLLAQMDSRYLANLSAITGLTGGGASNLDSQITADVAVGFRAFLTPTIAGIAQPKVMGLITDPDPGVTVTNEDPAAGTLIILPADYDAATNAKIWTELL